MTLPLKHNFAFSDACDCHVHIVGPTSRFPQAADRHYTADLATIDSLRALGRPLGISRYVLVQPSFYGMDNTCVLETLDALRGNGRGVVVLDPTTVTSGQVAEYERRGARGVRLNFYSKATALGAVGFGNALRRFTEILPPSTWHVELIATLPTLISAAEIIRGSTLPIVIDHYGLPDEVTPESEKGGGLLDLLRLPHVWMKLSAPYRVVSDPVATIPPADWLAALIEAAPDRCVWGSDWPYAPPREQQTGANVTIPYRKIDYQKALGDFLAALPTAALAERVLVSNPARLYGFQATEDPTTGKHS